MSFSGRKYEKSFRSIFNRGNAGIWSF